MRMNEALEGLDGISISADNVIIYDCGNDYESAEKDHDSKIIKSLERCIEKNLKLNPDKFKFKQKSVKYRVGGFFVFFLKKTKPGFFMKS